MDLGLLNLIHLSECMFMIMSVLDPSVWKLVSICVSVQVEILSSKSLCVCVYKLVSAI